MPFSTNTYDSLIKEIISQLRPNNFLDIGPGAGKYGNLVRDVASADNFICKMTAIEYDKSYIEEYKLEELYQDVKHMDARNLLTLENPIEADLCIIGDVLEHLPQSDGFDLLNYLVYRVKRIILVIPLDLAQEEWLGHSQEAHISSWYPSAFASFLGSSFVLKKFSGIDFLLVVINGNQVGKKDWLSIFDDGDHISFGFPYKNLSTIDIDLLSNNAPSRIALSNDLKNRAWNKRGNIQIESSDLTAADGISSSNKCTFLGVGEIWQIVDGHNGASYSPSLYIKKASNLGLIHLLNPVHELKGFYEIDLSKCSNDWNLITKDHHAVKIIHPFVGFSRKIGIHLRNISNDAITINIWGAQI